MSQNEDKATAALTDAELRVKTPGSNSSLPPYTQQPASWGTPPYKDVQKKAPLYSSPSEDPKTPPTRFGFSSPPPGSPDSQVFVSPRQCCGCSH
jgi:hypothetical protein